MWDPLYILLLRGFPASLPPRGASICRRTGSALCSLGIWGPCCCCCRNTHSLENLCSMRQQSAKQQEPQIMASITQSSKIYIKIKQIICVSAAVHWVLRLTVTVYLKWLNVGMCVMYVEEYCGVLSRSTAEQNELHSAFHTELWWLDSLGASVKITLVRLSLCISRYVQGVCECVLLKMWGQKSVYPVKL